VLGHVDHGKSSILDKIRGTAITAKEAGGITQAIGASIIPLDTVKRICGKLLDALKLDFTIPGLLFIDTPGHAAFTSLRKRGGSMADIAVVVIDVNEGFKPQTKEAIEILRAYKTPFVIAANKMDLINGWSQKSPMLLQDIQEQRPEVITALEERLYRIVGELHDHFAMGSERFDRVEDYTKQVAIVPCSAKTGEGIPELIMVVAGLAQRYLEQGLALDAEGDAEGSILEVKEEKGLGITMDVILFDGTLHVGDTIVIGGLDAPIVTRAKALFEPMPLAEMRDAKSKFKPVKEAVAATGVKIAAPDTEKAVAGMPLRSCSPAAVEAAKAAVMEEIEQVVIETDDEGIVIKTDNLGSLEALINLLRAKGIPIRKATIGEISKKDITDAESSYEKDPLLSVILAFNIKVPDEARAMSKRVRIIASDVIYRLIDDYEAWRAAQAKALEARQLDLLVRPCKLQLLRGYVFRQSNPAVVGCEIIAGKAKPGMPLMNAEGRELTSIKALQQEQESISEAAKGKQVAVSMENVIVGRQVSEGDVLYSAIPEDHFRKIKELKRYLTPDETEAIKEIAQIMRKSNPVWGV
jgi:translation initiation factor 5B